MIKINTVAFCTLLFRECRRLKRIAMQTVASQTVTIALYFIIFGRLIGSHLRDIQGYNYLQFIVPGLAMMALITNAYANSSSSFYGVKFSRSVEELLISPMSNHVILLGYVMGGVIRGALVAVVVLIVARFFEPLHFYNVWIMLLAGLFTAAMFSLGGFINAVFAKNFDDLSIVPSFILAPLTYLGGVFYSITQLSPFWQKVALANPILSIIEMFRYGMLGIHDVSISIGFGIIFLFTFVFYIIAIQLLNKGVGLQS